MRRLNQHRISVELSDMSRCIIRQRRIKCDASNKISLDVVQAETCYPTHYRCEVTIIGEHSQVTTDHIAL